MATDLFGWDLIYRSVEKDLVRKDDLLVAFTHWFIIKNGFLCVGNGDSKVLTGNEVKSEVLTPGWNQNDDYNIRYLYDARLYLLRVSKTGNDIIFNFLRSDDLTISSCVFKLDETIGQLHGDISTMIPEYKNVLSILRKELVEPVFTRVTHTAAGTQTTETSQATPRQGVPSFSEPPDQGDPLFVQPRRPPPVGIDPIWGDPFRDPLREPLRDPMRDPLRDPMRDPSTVGRSDLDPFGRGGGMIFDPFGSRTDRRGNDPINPGPSPPGLPRGAVPPGARFDPFDPFHGSGAAGRGNRRPHPDPDPDHLPPPGYDDMFM